MHGFTPSRELFSDLYPHTSTGEVPDKEIPPMKPKTETTKRAICCQRNHQPTSSAASKANTSISFESAHPPRGAHCGSNKTRSGTKIEQDISH
ncbi:hypothetical protein CRG98_014220 [Punica granatum]|uniref:Uncharacterized protein n=1 Tax=Punica granatum TaxID=22663 RepID=A0A2I0KA64_PUNGR|nr:hypothetical protein CRG98_014220 [Punica granatum]